MSSPLLKGLEVKRSMIDKELEARRTGRGKITMKLSDPILWLCVMDPIPVSRRKFRTQII